VKVMMEHGSMLFVPGIIFHPREQEVESHSECDSR
jgi:hypothetical protein